MDLVSPTLTRLEIICSEVHSTRPAVCPRLLALELSVPFQAANLENLIALTSLRIGDMVECFPYMH